jgi:hypothetical protein
VNKNILINTVLMIFTLELGVSNLFASTIYSWKNHDLDFFVASPPALVFVQDSLSNITGADPSKGLDAFGRGAIIQGIPGTFVEQDNTISDAVNGISVPNRVTSWSINIADHAAETYVVNLVGVSTGMSELSISGLFAVKLKIPQIENDVNILVTKGITKQIKVAFDPAGRSLTTTSIINKGDFSRDTQAVCGLGDIDPAAACEALEALASEVEKAISGGDKKNESEDLEVYLLILDRLHLWGQRDEPRKWDDFKDRSECADLCRNKIDDKFFIDETAYSALTLDAETLLGPLKKKGDHDWRDGRR